MAQQREQQRPPADARVAAIAAALTGAAIAGTAAAAGGYAALNAELVRRLTRLWLSWGYRRETIRYGLRTTVQVRLAVTRTVAPAGPPPDLEPDDDPTGGAGAAEAANERARELFAATFLDRTTDRYERAVQSGVDPDEAEQRERRYLEQHLEAQRRRERAAEAVDQEAEKPDQTRDGSRVILLWRAHNDDKVTPECRAADGCWFYADTPPRIGYPGMPHGGTCRCRPAKAPALAVVARLRTVDEATRSLFEPGHQPFPGTGTTDERKTA